MKKSIILVALLLACSVITLAQNTPPANRPQIRRPNQNGIVNLDSLRWRDMCIVADPTTKTYYILGPGGRGVRSYSSKDLVNWEGPKMIYTALQDVWGTIPIVSIWAPWSKISDQYGCNVTDGPYLYKGKTGKLYMIWTSGGYTGYTQGIAISESGKLAGPWKQQAEPLYKEDGGHGMLFTTFEGRLMMVLHSPNNMNSRPRIFEMEDTGEMLHVVKEFTGHNK